ncbi:restriction endonuclease subunit S [Pollutimonas sp. M17]|uniref:restriction endonuclease subunit S n=1 Tax=Pollutimonas sp. M17 TaxID=2962065 RepID=UPI0021F3C9B2|nr:restriction endonuclease subunit S [Pollutimonas sp. M17]UYO93043.1 restriction endonuclease subunit S [Pollutimonas sp. M17]
MEVTPGYKQTEVGVIPEDWGIRTVFEIAGYQKARFDDGDWIEAEHISDGGYRIVQTGNIGMGKFVEKDAKKYIYESSFEKLKCKELIPGDILICRLAEPAGRACILPNLAETKVVTAVDVTIFRPAEIVADRSYLVQYFSTPQWFESVLEQVGGTTHKRISRSALGNIKVPCPNDLDEQRTIAAALNDMDALLDGLDRLIAKKRAIKQATMQQLLTGQTRLPGFNRDWEVKRLGDHLTFLKNGVNSRAELSWGDDVLYLHYGDIHGSSRVMLDPASVEMPSLPRVKASRLDRLQNGDLIFADASEDMDGIGKSVEIQNATGINLVSGLHTIVIRFDKSVLADGFKAYIQFIPKFHDHLRQLAAGTKVYATNRAHIASAELRLPSIDEQQAISSLLIDMEAEITALETRHIKTRALKQAMMQELLTGRTRLVKSTEKPDEEAAAQTEGRKANVHFLRSVLAAEIIDQLHEQPTFGHVKFEKMMFLAEHLCEVDIGSTYHRKAAGPYDNRALRSIDSQLQKQQWFEARKQEGRYQYVPLAKRGGHKPYFDRHFSGIVETFEKILSTFKTAKSEQCEIVATLLVAWSDLLREKGAVSDEMIVHEVLYNWHEAKQRISEDRWLKALRWMREKGFVPKGVTLP